MARRARKPRSAAQIAAAKQNLIKARAARSKGAASTAKSAAKLPTGATKPARSTKSVNEQITAINVAVSHKKHQSINEQAVMSTSAKRQMAGLRGMGLAPTASNLAVVQANIRKKSSASSKQAPMSSHDAPGKGNVTVKVTTYAKHRMSGDPIKQARAFQSKGRYGTVIQSKSRGTSYDIETRRAKR